MLYSTANIIIIIITILSNCFLLLKIGDNFVLCNYMFAFLRSLKILNGSSSISDGVIFYSYRAILKYQFIDTYFYSRRS